MSFCALKWALFLFSIWSNNNICITGLEYIDLSGSWILQNTIKDYNYSVTVPGGIYSDLMNHNIIDDVFYGNNDISTRWVSKTDWNYTKVFKGSSKLSSHDKVVLVFDGVDTFSRVLVNGIEVGTTDNMFVRYIFDITKQLKVDENKIEVQFKSAVNSAKDAFDGDLFKIVPLCVPEEYNGECHANYVRKMQASFSWDWGPALPSVGIWKGVYVEAYNVAVIRYVTTKLSTSPNANDWDVQFHVYLQTTSYIEGTTLNGTIDVSVQTDIGTESNSYPVSIEHDAYKEYIAILSMKIKKSAVQRWWPNGYGEAKLYNVNVSFNNILQSEKSTKKFRLGFRTAELVQDEVGSGRLFYFKVNDVPIYAKGSNSIPINILPELGQNEDTIRFLLQSAKDVHMNMLRVWGGGTYESDFFYDLADEMGILIWQDFMFACSMYPANADFLGNVISEVKHQVRRLQHHPSIILWAGNNENEAALRQNWYGTALHYKKFKSDYIELYVETIQTLLLRIDDTRQYLISSPTNGIKSIEEGHIAQNPQSHFYGDVHFYNYVEDSWNSTMYPINRFASEYGYQSLPSINTWLTATNNASDLKIGSVFLENRQHLPEGYKKLDVLINFRLTLPSTESENYTQAYIYYSQIIQAMAVKIETELNRQWRSIFNDEGKGRTMGALYWQLNDVWVAPTWSGIDFKNNWKMMQYYAKHFFAPIIVTGDLTPDGKVDIYVVSDLTEIVRNAVLTISVYEWGSFDPVHNSNQTIDVLPSSSKKLKSFSVEQYFSEINNRPCGIEATKNCFLYFTLTNDKNETVAPDNYIFPMPLKSTTVKNQLVTISNVTSISGGNPNFAIETKASGISLFVWLEAKGIRGRFSDNGFQQITATKITYFTPENSDVTLSELERSLSVIHLMAEVDTSSNNGQTTLEAQCTTFFLTYFGMLLLLKLT